MEDARPSHTRGIVLTILAVAMAVGLAFAAVGALGRMARARVHDDPRYQLEFTAITCTPPPPLAPQEFLSQVQYLSDMPSHLNILDDDLAERVARAFRQHPWVDKVERVEILPNRSAQVHLRYREPVLAVPLGGKRRAVDRDGILLPIEASTTGLPVYPDTPAAPVGLAGQRWGDPRVETAARRAGR